MAGKAKRLLKSCERNDVCCKATEAPGALGPGHSIKEGSEEYRLEVIRMKPNPNP